MSKKLSDKDKKDWQNFLSNEEKLPDKDLSFKKKIRDEKIKKIDLHGYTLAEANKAVVQFIQKCFDENVTKITDAKIDDGGSGAFYVHLKNKFKIK